MTNNNEGYYRQKANKNSKLMIIAAFAVVLAVLGGILTAYFSDLASGSNELNTSTLQISAQYSYYINGEQVNGDNASKLNPGDALLISGVVTNSGNQSAWVRNSVQLGESDAALLPFIEVYAGAVPQAELLLGTAQPQLTMVEGVVSAPVRVIDGSGEGAQIESGGGYDYVGSNEFSFSITLYFTAAAPNTAQGLNLKLTVLTQALQFANNNAALPTEQAWGLVQ